MIGRALPGIAPIALVLLGCGAPSAESGGPLRPVALQLADPSGHRFDLQDLRGKPLLVLVFATYDEASQLAITSLERFFAHEHTVSVLAIAAQPQAAQLLPLHRQALGLHVPLAYDPSERIVAGDSALGPLRVIPTYFVIDARGRVRARHEGPLDQAGLRKLLASAS